MTGTATTIGLKGNMGTRWRSIPGMGRRRMGVMDRRAGMRIGMGVGPRIFILVYWRYRAHGWKVVAATAIMTTGDMSRRMQRHMGWGHSRSHRII